MVESHTTMDLEIQGIDKSYNAGDYNQLSSIGGNSASCSSASSTSSKPRWGLLGGLLICVAVIVLVISVAVTQTKDNSSSDTTRGDAVTGDFPVASPPVDSAPVDSPMTPPVEPPVTSPVPPSVTPPETPVATPPEPTNTPTMAPTIAPTMAPSTDAPTISLVPTQSPAPTMAPSQSPTRSPSPTTNDEEKLRMVLLPYSEALNDPDSVQSEAIRVLASSGAVDMPNTDRLLQRFALVTLHLTLKGSQRRTLLELDANECSWEGIECNGTVVTKLVWTGQELTGSIPAEVGLLKSVTYLDLAENNIAGEIPDSLYDLVHLEYLYLHDNKLTGVISERVANLFGLIRLYLGDNQLTGSFPKELGSPSLGRRNVRPLRYLNLYNNNLQGPFPENLNLRHLFYLDVGHNNMTGSLPTDWWAGSDSLLRIRHLYLNDNHFSGEIPQEFTTMGFGRIDQVVLHNNQFEGTFPGGWDPVEFLQVVSIFNNKFRAIHKDICQMSVFVGGELTSLRADCDICKCGAPYCVRPRCTAR